jgi:hypothetical protein
MANTTDKLSEMLRSSALDLPVVIQTVERYLHEAKETMRIVGPIMDHKTRLAERVKLLQVELFIAFLKRL